MTITHRQEENIVIVVRDLRPPGQTRARPSNTGPKDAAELKDKHPAAHQLFERYNSALPPGGRK